MAGLCRIDEQSEQSDDQTKRKSSSQSNAFDPSKLSPVVEQNALGAEKLRQQAVSQIVEELG